MRHATTHVRLVLVALFSRFWGNYLAGGSAVRARNLPSTTRLFSKSFLSLLAEIEKNIR